MDGRSVPNAERRRSVGAILTVMGVTFIVVGLVRVADSLTLAETIAYIVSAGIGGVVMLGSGIVFLTSAQVRGQWATIDRVQAELRL
jgi:hypothetical protein